MPECNTSKTSTGRQTACDFIAKARDVEKDIGTKLGQVALARASQVLNTSNLRTNAGKQAVTGILETLFQVRPGGCKACEVLDQAASDLRKMWRLRPPVPAPK